MLTAVKRGIEFVLKTEERVPLVVLVLASHLGYKKDQLLTKISSEEQEII